MTITKLIKQLEALKEKVGPLAQVTIDKRGVTNMSHDDWSHCIVTSVQTDAILWEKDGSTELANGQERIRTVVVLNGE